MVLAGWTLGRLVPREQARPPLPVVDLAGLEARVKALESPRCLTIQGTVTANVYPVENLGRHKP
jgi:hypothetical protein